ncbi:MAG: hypothetical protein ACI3VB_05730 [Oscillospiraceae bacterium]
MKIAKHDVKLLLVLAGLLIFLASYLLVFNPFQKRTQEVKSRINELQPQVQALEEDYLLLAEYEDGIETSRANVAELLKFFPADVKEEDVLSYLLTMEAHENIRMESVTFMDPELVRQFDAVLEQDRQDVIETMEVYRTSTVMTGTMSYPQAKNVIDYFYASPMQTNLENVALTFNAETGLLTGTFQLVKYYIKWPGATYTPEQVPTVERGVRDLFGTT